MGKVQVSYTQTVCSVQIVPKILLPYKQRRSQIHILTNMCGLLQCYICNWGRHSPKVSIFILLSATILKQRSNETRRLFLVEKYYFQNYDVIRQAFVTAIADDTNSVPKDMLLTFKYASYSFECVLQTWHAITIFNVKNIG